MPELSTSKAVTIGQPIPDCEFEIFHNEQRKNVKLSEYEKKWLILFFYPADFTFVCPTELEEMAHNYQEFFAIGAEVISVSTDTVYIHKAWHDNSPAIKKISFPMAADPTGALSKMFGTYIEHQGLSLRGTFIIDPNGILKAFEVNDNSIGRSATELLRKLKAAQYVSTHTGEVCPASWQPGAPTLKPGLDLVGRI